ncbi:MAG: hypothetical protein IPM98_19180 [Lewinellaceae bacterium]|nr:hypothetical protein [Lewinellaceae bacterium]
MLLAVEFAQEVVALVDFVAGFEINLLGSTEGGFLSLFFGVAGCQIGFDAGDFGGDKSQFFYVFGFGRLILLGLNAQFGQILFPECEFLLEAFTLFCWRDELDIFWLYSWLLRLVVRLLRGTILGVAQALSRNLAIASAWRSFSLRFAAMLLASRAYDQAAAFDCFWRTKILNRNGDVVLTGRASRLLALQRLSALSRVSASQLVGVLALGKCARRVPRAGCCSPVSAGSSLRMSTSRISRFFFAPDLFSLKKPDRAAAEAESAADEGAGFGDERHARFNPGPGPQREGRRRVVHDQSDSRYFR